MVSGEHLFRVTKGLMLIAGIWKLEMPGVSARYKKMYSIYGVVVQVAYILTLSSCLIKFCQLFGVDNDKAVECLSMLSIVCVLSVKGLSCQTEQVTSILRRTIDQVNTIFSSEDSHVKNMFYKYSRYNHWLNIFVTIYCFSLGLHLNIIGLVQYYQMTQQYGNETENMDKPQMTLNWYPFDPNEHYVFVLFYQLISVLWSDLLYSSVQTLFNTIMLQLTAQFKILQHDFKHFACDRLSGKPVSKQEAYRNMKRLIKKHQDLISYTEDFNSALKYPILLEYIVCSLMLASIFVQIISGKKMLFNVQYFLILTLQFSIFSWNANEIRTQSENISFALYESNWYEQSAQTKKLMFIVVLRTKRPLSLNIGPFGPLTNDATVSRLKLAYSYVSLISNRKSVHE